MHNISARMVLDTINPDAVRMMTLEVIMPKFLIAQLNTHRQLIKNSASSRAIPVTKNIGYILDNPVTPMDFGMPANGKGMIPKATMEGINKVLAGIIWKTTMYFSLGSAYLLSKLGLHKAWTNRIIEPFTYTKVVISGTEWDNFFNLRLHGDAQDAMQETARVMNHAIISSTPTKVAWGTWHLPYVGNLIEPTQADKDVSVSCCAQVSFRTFDLSEDKAARVVKALSGNTPHASPFEQIAQAVPNHSSGSLGSGWVSYRHIIWGMNK